MSRETAVERVREAQTDWDKAIRAHEQVMPELLPFAARLRRDLQRRREASRRIRVRRRSRAPQRWRRTRRAPSTT